MKKKCRVYKPQSMQAGGPIVPMTQDSQQGSVPQEKSNQFMSWVKQNTELAQLDQELNKMKLGGTPYNYQYGGSPDGYGELEPLNNEAFQQAYDNMNYNPIADIQTLASNTYNAFTPKQQTKNVNGETYQPVTPKPEPFSFGSKAGGFGQGMQKGFQLPQAQQGIQVVNEVNYPDYGMGFMPEVDNSDYLPNGGLDFMAETDNSGIQLPDIYATEQDYNSGQTGPLDESQYTTGPDVFNEKKKSRNPYALTQGVLAGARLLTGFGQLDERAALEQQINKKFSNVHEAYGTMGADRGDYMANVPGVGDPLKPNQHTRMGYNTKIAQYGMAIQDNTKVAPQYIPERLDLRNYTPEAEDIMRKEGYRMWEEDKAAGKTMLSGPESNYKAIYNAAEFYDRPQYAGQDTTQPAGIYVGNPSRYVELEKQNPRSIQLRQQGGEYNIDDELDATEEKIAELIAKGYNLKYLD